MTTLRANMCANVVRLAYAAEKAARSANLARSVAAYWVIACKRQGLKVKRHSMQLGTENTERKLFMYEQMCITNVPATSLTAMVVSRQ